RVGRRKVECADIAVAGLRGRLRLHQLVDPEPEGPDLVDLGWSRRDLHPAVLDAVNGGAGAGDGVDVIERLWTNDLVRGVGRLLAGRCRSARYGEGCHGDHDADGDRR